VFVALLRPCSSRRVALRCIHLTPTRPYLMTLPTRKDDDDTDHTAHENQQNKLYLLYPKQFPSGGKVRRRHDLRPPRTIIKRWQGHQPPPSISIPATPVRFHTPLSESAPLIMPGKPSGLTFSLSMLTLTSHLGTRKRVRDWVVHSDCRTRQPYDEMFSFFADTQGTGLFL